MAAYVGRKRPCPCGSGKKYKRCCGRTSQTANETLRTENTAKRPIPGKRVKAIETPRHAVPPHVLRYFEEKLYKQAEYTRIYGAGRPPVITGDEKERFVAVGGELFKSNWKT